MRPPRALRRACERAGFSSPAPPGPCSGEVLVSVLPLSVFGAWVVAVLPVRSVAVAVRLGGLTPVSVFSLSPPHPASTAAAAPAAHRDLIGVTTPRTNRPAGGSPPWTRSATPPLT